MDSFDSRGIRHPVKACYGEMVHEPQATACSTCFYVKHRVQRSQEGIEKPFIK